jgi:AraC-like DNA-binding protein
VNQFDEPRDYLVGYSPQDALEIPFGILCFYRKDATQLLRNSGHFHRDHHHRHVLICALRGSGEICIDNRIERLEPGSVLFISPYQFHHYRAFSSRQITWLYLTFELRTDFLVRSLSNGAALCLGPDELSLLKQVLQAWQGEREGPQLPLLLGAFLCRLRGKARPPSGAEVSLLPDSGLLRQINTLVLEKECFPLKELATILNMSESNLRSRFRTATGLSLGHHIRRLRIQKACSLLASSPLRIYEIAEACRFSSVYSFSRSFRVGVGVSPSQYRRRQQKYTRRYAEI